MRVISGIYKGRRLKTVEGQSVRPTSDRLRETLFNVLKGSVEGAKFVDLCAGSGAVGIEALSRGAAHVTFVESARRAAAIINENLAHCKIEDHFRVINRDAVSVLRYFASYHLQYDIFYFDPPYDSDLYTPVMQTLAKSRIVAEAGIVIVEHRRKFPLSPNYESLRPYREINQGDTTLTFYSMERGIA
ncbi:MAG TPA: 16S rRNA (guanine(966)-N(2))-methyltransferase RsmD [Blastocatellia bacterium]|nr:16S rRNA (guanine(966)-N(2))-methyltransferase RsmD [Blastocatellia bacterium]